MADLGGHLPVPLQHIETNDMVLKWIAMKKQECKSRIVRAKQDIEDLKEGKIPDIERQILHAEAELIQLTEHEKNIKAKGVK